MERDAREAVRAYYAGFAEQEWQRLERPDDGAVEFALHTRFLSRWLPPVPPGSPHASRVLDLGGGPGRYAIWLARQGYHVVLGDLSPGLLAVARERIAAAAVGGFVEDILELDATDLSSLPDASFDAVLALGPFYHLPAAEDRDRAAREIQRVLRPHGILFAAVMPRYARLLATVLEQGAAAFPETVRRLLEEGRYDDERPARFTGAYLFRPEEIDPFFTRHGFSTLALLASQGLLGLVQADVAALRRRDPRAYELLLDVAEATAGDPSILGLAVHVLYVGRRAG
jgi:SAM-dependent methyltransferase